MFVALLAVVGVGCQAQSQAAGYRDAALPAPADVDLSGLEPPAREVELTYAVTVGGLSPDAEQVVVVWVPLPVDNGVQSMRSWRLLEDHPAEVVEDAEFGNRFVRVDLTEAVGAAESGEVALTFEFEVERRAYSAWTPAGGHEARELTAADLAPFLEPDRLVPTDGFIAQEARQVVGDAEAPFDKASRLYEHVVETMRYDKSGEGWGRGDAVYACDARTGNCTDFHSLFMAEARSVGVPAEFVIGVPLPPDAREGEIPGYHCWAEFYLDGRGWVPVDASEAYKQPERRRFFFGSLDAHRVEFTTGRDLDLPGASVQSLNYVIYPHVEVDGALHEDVRTAFRFKEGPGETEMQEAAAAL
ncbi:MAG: transglutaminase-like domain-containing protein [Thermoanaerobaculia bacterium]